MSQEIAPGIVIDPKVRFGKPVIKGTRVPVELVIAKLAGGMSPQEVAEEYEITNELLLHSLAQLGNEVLKGLLTIVEPGRIRIRRHPPRIR